MWVPMHQCHMSVRVCVRLFSELARMFMLVVVPMHMPMVMFDFSMDMEVVMTFPKEEYDPHRHDH